MSALNGVLRPVMNGLWAISLSGISVGYIIHEPSLGWRLSPREAELLPASAYSCWYMLCCLRLLLGAMSALLDALRFGVPASKLGGRESIVSCKAGLFLSGERGCER